MKPRLVSLLQLSALVFSLGVAPTIVLAADDEPQIREYSQSEIKNLKTSAEKGDASSQLEFGKSLISLRDSKKIHVSESEIRKWFGEAAQQNVGEAWYWLVTRFRNC